MGVTAAGCEFANFGLFLSFASGASYNCLQREFPEHVLLLLRALLLVFPSSSAGAPIFER